jgi:broad specificity phosphatase PhoE
MTKLILVRHGESEANRQGIFAGHIDPDLQNKGLEQAKLTGKYIADNYKVDKIYASDLSRARRTAEIAIPGCEYEVSELLREINVGNIAGKELGVVKRNTPDAAFHDGYVAYGGESVAEFRERIGKFISLVEKENFENVVAFTHGGLIRNFLEMVMGVKLPRKNLCCKNCMVAVFEYSDSTWKLHSWINLD